MTNKELKEKIEKCFDWWELEDADKQEIEKGIKDNDIEILTTAKEFFEKEITETRNDKAITTYNEIITELEIRINKK